MECATSTVPRVSSVLKARRSGEKSASHAIIFDLPECQHLIERHQLLCSPLDRRITYHQLQERRVVGIALEIQVCLQARRAVKPSETLQDVSVIEYDPSSMSVFTLLRLWIQWKPSWGSPLFQTRKRMLLQETCPKRLEMSPSHSYGDRLCTRLGYERRMLKLASALAAEAAHVLFQSSDVVGSATKQMHRMSIVCWMRFSFRCPSMCYTAGADPTISERIINIPVADKRVATHRWQKLE